MSLDELKIGGQLRNGYFIDDLYIGGRGRYVLAHSPHRETPEPYVVWDLNQNGETYNGRYFIDALTASLRFRRLCTDAERSWWT